MNGNDESQIIALAVDGMEQTLVERWIEAGELPNLATLRDNGAFGTANCSSLSSATQWVTHFTGVGPESHGVDGFLTSDKKRSAGDRAPEAGELINLSNILVKTYPELLDTAGARVGLVNPLPLWPPLELENGFCVSGMLTPPKTDRWVFPPELEADLDALGYQIDVRYGDRPYGFVDDDLFDEVSLDQLHEDMFDVLDARIEFTKQTIRERELDYLYVLLKSIDVIQHCFWAHMESDDPTYGDAILESYRRVDDLIGWVRERIDGHLLVFSDHGFKRRTTDPPSRLHQIASTVSDVAPVPERAKRLYYGLATSPMTTEVDNDPSINSTTGVHANPAAWMLDGPAVESRSNFEIEFKDIPPTILALLDQPIPDAYVGEPVDAVQKDVITESISLSIRRDVTIADSEVISERLHNLGYADMVDDN